MDLLPAAGVDLLALLPCPVKVPFEQAFREFIKESQHNLEKFSFRLEGHINHHLSFYDLLEKAQAKTDLPNIMITPGVNRFMGHTFQKKFLGQNIFAREQNYFHRPESLQSNLVDSKGYYFILAINPLVIVVDHTQIGDVPVPSCWADLLLPHYKGQIVMRGQKETFCETVLLSFYKEFQLDGIRRLANNVKLGCHPSEMAKHAGTGKSGWPAISLMPYFFAKTIRNADNVTIIWPEDGVIASPITMMVQNTAIPHLRPVIDFLTGPAMGKLWSNAFFFAPFSEIKHNLPCNRQLKWLGWDFIYSVDAYQLFAQLNSVFREARQNKPKEGAL